MRASWRADTEHTEAMPHFRHVVAGLLSLLCLLPLHSFADAPLKLGIMPFNSTLALIKTHQPLVRHLEDKLQRKVVILTSTDYFTYVNELLAGQFDLAIAGPHFGSLGRERGYTILYRYSANLQPLFVVRTNSTIQHLDDLRGKRIGLSSRLSISSIGGVKWLDDHGLLLDRDYTLSERATHGAAIAAVATGEVDAALTTQTPLNQVPEDIRQRLRTLPLNMHVPHLMTLVADRLGDRDKQRIRQALKDFASTPAGQEFFRETGYLGYSEVSASDLVTLRPFVELTVRMMRQGG